MWIALRRGERTTRRFGHPVPEHLTVIRARLGARTVRREICAPRMVSTPLMRTTGKGFIRLACVGAATTVAGTGACSVGSGCATGWTGAGAGGVTTGGGVGVAVGAGAGAGLATGAVAGDNFHTRSRG